MSENMVVANNTTAHMVRTPKAPNVRGLPIQSTTKTSFFVGSLWFLTEL